MEPYKDEGDLCEHGKLYCSICDEPALYEMWLRSQGNYRPQGRGCNGGKWRHSSDSIKDYKKQLAWAGFPPATIIKDVKSIKRTSKI